MTAWRAALIVCVVGATAAAAPLPVQVPAGWTEHRDLAESSLGSMRSVPQVKNVEVTMFMSPQDDAQLTVMTFEMTLNGASKTQIEGFDSGMAKGAAKKADHHVRDSRVQRGNRILATSIDELGGARIHYERIYAVDRNDVIHMVSAICTASPASIGTCEDIQKTLRLDLADAADIKDEDLAYKLGYALGGIIAAVGLGMLIRRLR